MKTYRLIATFLMCVVLAQPSFADQPTDSAATLAAENFLRLVDAGRYAESWAAASELLKSRVAQQEWVAQLETIRPGLGTVSNRKIEARTHARSLPGVPAGDYLVIQFSTAFAHRKNATEIVTPRRESNGEWWVSGYYIR